MTRQQEPSSRLTVGYGDWWLNNVMRPCILPLLLSSPKEGEMFPHQRNERLQEAFDTFSDAVIASNDDTLRRLLVELSTCIMLAYGWDDMLESSKIDIIRRLSAASRRIKLELGRVQIRVRMPDELVQFASGAPPANLMLNISRQAISRAIQNIQDCGAKYPDDRKPYRSSPCG